MRVLEVFEAHQTAYYVKEYLDEGSLAESLAHRSHFCTEETLFFVQRICAALDVLHQNKMQHLDLKPSNILLGGVEQVVLTDFGLSKHRLSDGMLEASTDIGRGASDYAPLEQGLCGDDDVFRPTIDVYSLGAILYQLLTGLAPLDALHILNEGFNMELFKRRGGGNV